MASKKRAIINGMYIEMPTDDELDNQKRYADNASFHRESERDDYYKDIIQPYIGNKPNPEFIRAYPKQAQHTFTKDELKNY